MAFKGRRRTQIKIKCLTKLACSRQSLLQHAALLHKLFLLPALICCGQIKSHDKH